MNSKIIGICMAAFMSLSAFAGLAKDRTNSKEDKQLTKLYNMTPKEFASCVDIEDD